jgi:tight adherence protein C
MIEMMPLLIAFIAFVAVTTTVLVAGRALSNQVSVQRRLPLPVFAVETASQGRSANFLSFITRKIDEKKLGVDSALRSKLRRELVRAGYFSDESVRYYVLAKFGVIILFPLVTYIFSQVLIGPFGYLNFGLVAASTFIAIAVPDAFIARKQRHLQHQYRIVFPDLLDMLVVCVDAGLSLDASFGRIQPEVAKRSPPLSANLEIIGSETRAGRTTADALERFADRVNLDEVRAFVLALRQSIELGTDIADALRAFSDEMREKRLIRAEENANKLPVKMVVPLGTCIFPVILLSMMLPVVIRLLAVMGRGG